MADVAKLMCGPVLISTTAAAMYTAAAGVTPIVRNIHINNTSATAYTFSLGINGTPATAANAIYSSFYIAPFSAFDWSGFMVLTAAGSLWASSNSATALTLTVSGVETS